MPTYPIGQNATTARDGEVNVANVVKGHVNGSNVSDEAIIVPSGAVDLPTTADATNPASGSTRLVARAGGLYVRDETGTEVGPLGGAVAPLAHAASHQDGGSDELALDGSQITTGTVAPGRLGSGTPSAGTVLHGDGSWVETFAPGGWPAGSTIAMNAPPSAGGNDYAPSLNRSAVIPWTIGRSVTVDQVGLRATTVTNATTDEYRIYLYAPTGTRHPGVRLWVSGLVTFPTTGLHMFSTGSLVTLPPTSIYIVQRVTRFAGSNVRFDSVAFHDETVHSPTLTPPAMWSHNGNDLTGDSPTLSTLVAGFGPRLYLRTA